MRLPERFVLVIHGNRRRVGERHTITPTSLPHLMAQLLSGSDMPMQPFEAFGLRVWIEEDTDQGDDGAR
jgi:hypothetical protein